MPKKLFSLLLCLLLTACAAPVTLAALTPLVKSSEAAPSPQSTFLPIISNGGGGPTLNGCPLFPADNFWNTPIDRLPLHPDSEAWINSIGRNRGFHMDFGSGLWDGGPIGIPFTAAPAQTAFVPINFDEFGDESDPGPYPIPPSPFIEWGSDHHILIVHADQCKLYELYHAHSVGGAWYAGSAAVWQLNSNALRPNGWTSADAAGLPILPGLLRYDEVAAGEIRHALRFTAAQTAGYLWPARHQTSAPQSGIPPMGARFRLKASFDMSSYPADLQVILRAMQIYGIVLADNGSDWYVSGAPDERWNNEQLHLLDALTGADFEAVDTSALMINPDSAAAQQP